MRARRVVPLTWRALGPAPADGPCRVCCQVEPAADLDLYCEGCGGLLHWCCVVGVLATPEERHRLVDVATEAAVEGMGLFCGACRS